MRLRLLLMTAVLWLPSGAAVGDDELYKRKNCLACHRIEQNYLGPSLKSIASRYAADKDAAETLARRIREGSVGVWGQLPMPPQPQVTEAEASTLARWILQQK